MEAPRGGLGEEQGRLREAAGGAALKPTGPHPRTTPHHLTRHRPAPSSTVLPGGCPACDTHALQEALLCLEGHYAAFPPPGGAPFNGSHTFLEDAADVGALAIALQVAHTPGARISFDRPSCKRSCPSPPHRTGDNAGIPLAPQRPLLSRIFLGLLTSTSFLARASVLVQHWETGLRTGLGCQTSKWPRAWRLRGPLRHAAHPGVQQEAVMAPWGGHAAQPGPQPPAALLPELRPGRQLPPPPTLPPRHTNTSSNGPPVCCRCSRCRPCTRAPSGPSLPTTTNSSTKFSTL